MVKIGSYSIDDYLKLVERFHGAVAPGLVIGGFMVDLAMDRIPEGVLFDSISETTACLPDAVQLLTPCTVGNGWLKVFNLGRFALSLYDKYEGQGVRVFLDTKKLDPWPEIKVWFLKLKPKIEQDKELLLAQIIEAGQSIYGVEPIQVQAQFLKKKSRGAISTCVMCGEAYPARDGAICRACQGESPYTTPPRPEGDVFAETPPLKAVPTEQAVGKKALHDMTMILPGKSKGPEVVHGQRITAGDLCRLQQMGRNRVYVQEENETADAWVHEDEAALAFAKAMAGEGVTFEEPPREGKINLAAERDGLLIVEQDRLEQFNSIPGVMCASRRSYTLIGQGRHLAATRAIPLFLPRAQFNKSLSVLEDGPLFHVLALRKAKVGILVTGTEVFQGLIEDRFIPIITAKVEKYGCNVVRSLIAPDDRSAISKGVRQLMESGADLIVTTAGLSVDPDDLTRQGLVDAGASDMLYGAPIVPGAMILLAHIGAIQMIGVPACALFFKTTAFDLLLPRMLAGLKITRSDLAKMGHGAFCLGCKSCTFPKCPFGG
jgi:formylmethanofuran dehydrogenase subunit E